jgi:hypothetical protein
LAVRGGGADDSAADVPDTASNQRLTGIGIGLNLAAIVIGIVLTAVIWHANATSGA